MNTEITDKDGWETDANGWVLYDGNCRLCRDLALRCRPILEPRGFLLAPLQTFQTQNRLDRENLDAPLEMAILINNGRMLGGADAVLYLAGHVWWAKPLCWVSRLPGMNALLHTGYRWIARNRHCYSGACGIPREPGWPAWLPLVCLPLLTALCLNWLPAWVFMWAMAFSIFAGSKWLMWWPIRDALNREGRGNSVAFLLLWIGMDGRPFLDRRKAGSRPLQRRWLFACLKTSLGVTLIWGVVRFLPVDAHLLRGWVGMVGMIFLLHFGLFHLLAVFWNERGVSVRPLMSNPIAATSLAEFWGRRWNTGFHDLAFLHLFRPLAARTNSSVATLFTFAVSGLIHELVISLPSGAGYGLPTLYFVLQGFGALCERTMTGRRLGLGRGLPGWCFMLLITAAPVGCLFHPHFIRNVILPMLDTIGAT